MHSKKINLSQLRSLVRQIIKESSMSGPDYIFYGDFDPDDDSGKKKYDMPYDKHYGETDFASQVAMAIGEDADKMTDSEIDGLIQRYLQQEELPIGEISRYMRDEDFLQDVKDTIKSLNFDIDSASKNRKSNRTSSFRGDLFEGKRKKLR